MKHSYTTHPGEMQKFATREEAERNRCPGNEVVVDFERLLDTFRR